MPSASSRVLLLPALLLAFAASAQAPPGNVRLVVQSSPLAGFRYHAAASVWSEVRVGDALELAREPTNPHDPRAVSVSWRGRKLGYVPRSQNAALAWGMDSGERPIARITRISEHPNPARRLEFEVSIE